MSPGAILLSYDWSEKPGQVTWLAEAQPVPILPAQRVDQVLPKALRLGHSFPAFVMRDRDVILVVVAVAPVRAHREHEPAHGTARIAHVARRELPRDRRDRRIDLLAAIAHRNLAAREEGAHVTHHLGIPGRAQLEQAGDYVGLRRGDIAEEQHARARMRLALPRRSFQQRENPARLDRAPLQAATRIGEPLRCPAPLPPPPLA